MYNIKSKKFCDIKKYTTIGKYTKVGRRVFLEFP